MHLASPHQIEKALDPRRLTRDEGIAALAVVDNLLECCCGHRIAKRKGEGRSLPFERDMADLLLVNWGSASKAATKRAVNAINAGNGVLSHSELEAVLEIIEEEIDQTFAPAVRKEMPGVFTKGYTAARQAPLKKVGMELLWKGVDTDAVTWLTNHHMYWVGTYYNKNLSDKLALHVSQGLSEGLGRESIGKKLEDFFTGYPGVRTRPDYYWNGLAANGMNRARNFGLLPSYKEAGVVALEIMAVMDERTSDICRALNGRRISVSAALGQRDMLMTATNPEDVKTISPWVSADEVQGKPMAEVMNMGVIMPPYHFNCRTTVVEIRG